MKIVVDKWLKYQLTGIGYITDVKIIKLNTTISSLNGMDLLLLLKNVSFLNVNRIQKGVGMIQKNILKYNQMKMRESFQQLTKMYQKMSSLNFLIFPHNLHIMKYQ